MSDDFIPLNQSTPVQRQWNQNQGRNQNHNNQSGFRNYFNNGKRGKHQQWRNNSRNNSFISDNNSYGNTSYSNNKNSIDAYLHPSMLHDPWAQLRQNQELK